MHVLQPRHQVPDLSGPELRNGSGLGRVHAGLLGIGLHPRGEHLDPGVRGKDALLDAHVGDHPAVRVEHGVEDQGADRLRGIAHGRRHLVDHGLEQLRHALAGLRRDPQDLVLVAAQERGELLRALVGLGGRQVDLVDRGNDHQAGVARQVVVRKGLRLQTLGRIDQQDRALARGERSRHLVGEVHVPGRVDQVQLEPLVQQPDRLGLDRDAALALQVHLVQVLGPHVAALHRVGDLEQPIGQRGLAVVDMRHDAEVPDVGGVGHNATHGTGHRFRGASVTALAPRTAGS